VLRAIRPHVHAKGRDYTVENVPEAAIDRELGIEIAICGDAKDHASSRIAELSDQTSGKTAPATRRARSTLPD
jgi:bifunctional ADP-heptose synthase (sugar kinase/adenylyltransferase)